MKIIKATKEFEAKKIIKKGITFRGYNDDDLVFIVSGEEITGEYIEEISEVERIDALENAMLDIIMGGVK